MPTILFLTEAPSGSDKHFYKCNTVLYRSIKTAFEMQFGGFENDQAFLAFFESIGCKVDYLSPTPVDKTNQEVRKEARTKSIDSLSTRLKNYQPVAIIVVMISILNEVKAAIADAGLKNLRLLRAIPFPGIVERNRLNCIKEIKAVMAEIIV